jgi:hypothetical protein
MQIQANSYCGFCTFLPIYLSGTASNFEADAGVLAHKFTVPLSELFCLSPIYFHRENTARIQEVQCI